MKKYAEEITLITGIPCFYHLCKKWEQHAGRWVFIIGYTKVKDGKGGATNDIDFFRICNEKKYKIRTKCSEIDPRYEKYRTMMELDDGTEDVLKVENRFSTLPVEDMSDESDEDLGSHIYDDDTDVETTEGLDQAHADSDNAADSFTEVKSSSAARKPGPKYSTPCHYEFSCLKGRRCDYTHSQEQIDFFKANDGKGRKGYKSKPCFYHYRNRSCQHGSKDQVLECAYYHSPKKARCYVCKNDDLPYIGHASHDQHGPL